MCNMLHVSTVREVNPLLVRAGKVWSLCGKAVTVKHINNDSPNCAACIKKVTESKPLYDTTTQWDCD